MKHTVMITKRLLSILMALLLASLPVWACADGAGVLSEGELNAWLTQALLNSAKETPLNAPIGEDALTEDGYAFIYSFATFFYDKPILDGQSVLRAIALTDNAYASPRGLKVGDDAALLVDSFGWQNPMLLGNDALASLYVRNQLPEAAYWSWAQREGDALSSVQCAIHVRAGDNRYTDAGITYSAENGVISGIRIYGLDALISEADVRGNLNAVLSVEASITGDDHSPEAAASGYYEKHDAVAFEPVDLIFSGVNYLSLTEATAVQLFGEALNTDRVRDDTGAWLVTTQREGLTLSYTVVEDEASATPDSLAVSGSLKGPRGIQVGMTAEAALKLFNSDGVGTVSGGVSVLYGDGVSPPTGILERDGDAVSALRYSAAAGERTITLHMAFEGGLMTEWMIYSW